jgi:prepilin-type processing-associated H-X9-DG protein
MLRQFGNADAMYVNANHGWHVPAWFGYYQYNRTWTGFDEFRKAMAMPIMDKTTDATKFAYVPDKYYCPKALRGQQGGVYSDSASIPGLRVLPLNYSYGMNVEGIDDEPARGGTGFDPANAPYADNTPVPTGATLVTAWASVHAYKANKVKRPAEKLFIADAMWIGINENGAGPDPARNYDKIGESNAAIAQRTTAWRHGKGYANVLFFDGHASSLHKTEIYNTDPTTGTITGNDKLWKVFQ